jgi:hypothetical protein
VADRLRAKGVDRRRRGKDRSAREESGELMIEGFGSHTVKVTQSPKVIKERRPKMFNKIRSKQMNILLWVLQILLALWNMIGGIYMVNNYEKLAKVWALNALPKPAWQRILA